MAIQKWIGEGIDPTVKAFPDGDILREIPELFRKRIELGLFTLFVEIEPHRGEFFDEMADRWADKGRGHGNGSEMDEPKATANFYMGSPWQNPPQHHE